MLTKVSPYHASAANLRENGFRVMPVWPGKKIPGKWENATWHGMPGWAKFCDHAPADFLHDKWEEWPDAGVCVAHGNIIGLDLDTDRQDVSEALHRAVVVPNVRRRGAKGWLGYYRPGEGLEGHTARVRWYDPKIFNTSPDGSKQFPPMIELLLHGTQSVLPPTIHPDTNKPYTWLTRESLENTDISELPEFSGDDLESLDRELSKLGLTKQAPRRVADKEYERPSASAHDLEKPFGRSLNDRAMEPSAIDQWWPALDMPKSRRRGHGAWEAVPWWRASGSGRAVQDRNPNLKAVPSGIIDFGADRSYTPADVVMAARDCSFESAAEWLGQYIRQEKNSDLSSILNMEVESSPGEKAPKIEDKKVDQTINLDQWASVPVFNGTRSHGPIKPIRVPSDAEWEALMPKEPPSFPIQSFEACEGLLGAVAQHIDNASATHTEAGALAVTLPLLGVAMGRAYESPSKLRTNIYSVALGGSGTGKTSLVNPAKELMQLGQISDLIGQDRIASGSGLIQMLSGPNPRRVCFLDEFGHMLQQIGAAGAGAHAKQIVTEFTALYSAAWTLFTGTAYATRDAQAIDCPHLCIFGMATPEQFWRAFGSSSMEDGSIARYLVFPLGKTGSKEPDDRGAQEIADAVKEIQLAINGRTTGNLGNADVMRVPINEHAEKLRLQIKEKENAFAEYAELNGVKGGPAIVRRVTENATKIALVSAIGRSPRYPEIDQRDMDIGHALAWWSANTMISSIASHIADNQYERDVNAVERFIMDGGDRGKSMSDLMRRFRSIKGRDMKEIIEALEKEESVVSEMVPSGVGGRPAKIVRSIS